MRLSCAIGVSLLVAACQSDLETAGPGQGGGGGTQGSSASTTSAGGGGSSSTSGASSTTASGAGGGSSAGGASGGGASGGGATGSGGGGAGSGGSTGSGGSRPDGGVAAGVRWVGRVDLTDRTRPKFGWSGSGFVASFTGTSVGVTLTNDDAYFFQPVIDGKKTTRFQAAKGMATRQVATGLSNGAHTLELYREIEASYGASQFIAITEATLAPPPAAPGRLIEFVGDFITAGYGNLGTEPHPNYTTPMPCHYTYDTQSAYMSYGAVTARALNADPILIAASGWGVYRSNGGDVNQVLPKVYGNTLGYKTPPAWDFSLKPDAVVIDLGTNDFAGGDPGPMYTSALGAFVDTIRSKYPNAWIFCAIGTMLGNPQHDQAKAYMQSVVNSHGGDAGKVALVDMGTQDALKGTGCDWHPNVAEDQRMADLLAPAIKQKLGW